MLRKLHRSTAAAALLAALAIPGTAGAKAHQWDILVLFSNAQGNVQFINLFISDPTGTEEWLLGGREIASDSSTYVFPNDLPMNQSTFLTWVLIATQDYADLPGAPTPDYIIPPQFFDPTGDTIRYRDTVDVFPIPPGVMPTDGVHSLERDLDTPVNVGINFAGDFGTVNAPPAVNVVPSWGIGVAALLLLLLAAGAFLGDGRRARA